VTFKSNLLILVKKEKLVSEIFLNLKTKEYYLHPTMKLGF